MKNVLKIGLLTVFITVFNFANASTNDIILNTANSLDVQIRKNKTSPNPWYIVVLGYTPEQNEDFMNLIYWEENQYLKKEKYTEKLKELNNKLVEIHKNNPNFLMYAIVSQVGNTIIIPKFDTFDIVTLNDAKYYVDQTISDSAVSNRYIEDIKRFDNLNTVSVKELINQIVEKSIEFKSINKKNKFIEYGIYLAFTDGTDVKNKSLAYISIDKYQGDDLSLDVFKINLKTVSYNQSQDYNDDLILNRLNQFTDVFNNLDFSVIQSVDGLKDGWGKELYFAVIANANLRNLVSKEDLIQTCNYISKYKIGYYIDYDSENKLDWFELNDLLIANPKYLNYNNFKELHKGHFRRESIERDTLSAVSELDVWRGLDLKNYNLESKDWVSMKSPNIMDKKYYYSLKDLNTRYNILNISSNDPIATSLILSESKGLSGPVNYDEFVSQYKAKFGTNDAVYFWAEGMARSSEEVLKVYLLHQMVLYSSREAVEGAVLDYAIQTLINYYTIEDINSWLEAADPDNINFYSISWSAFESTLKFKNSFVEAGLGSLGGCIVNGWTDAKGVKENFDFESCFIGAGPTIVFKLIIPKASPYIISKIKEFSSKGRSKVTQLLMKKGFSKKAAEETAEILEEITEESASTPNLPNIKSAREIILAKFANGATGMFSQVKFNNKTYQAGKFFNSVIDDAIEVVTKNGTYLKYLPAKGNSPGQLLIINTLEANPQKAAKAFFVVPDNIINEVKTAEQLEDLLKQIDLPNSAESGILSKGADGRLKIGSSASRATGVNQAGKVLDEAFESITSVQNLKKLSGVSVKQIDNVSLNQLKTLKTSNGIDELANVSSAEVSLNKTLNKTDFSSHSGFDNFQSKIPNGSASPNQNSKIFKTGDAPTASGQMRPRHNDAEVKIFEDIASQLGAKKGDVGTKVFNDVEGKIKLKTELCPCGSCSEVIEQFKNMFPKVELEILAQPKVSF